MQLSALSVSLVDQRLACDDRGVLVFVAHAIPKGSDTRVPKQYSTCFGTFLVRIAREIRDETWKDGADACLSLLGKPLLYIVLGHPVSGEQKSCCCVPSRLPQAIWCVFPCPAPLKPLAGGACVNLTQVCFDQDEGLLDELMQLVDRGQRIDTDDGKELFEARGKIGRGHLHLVHQAIQPPPARIVEAVESQQDEQELLVGRTEGVVEHQHLVALGQLFLLPGRAKRRCVRTIATARSCG